MKDSLLGKTKSPKSNGFLEILLVYSVFATIGLVVSISIFYPMLYDRFDKVSSTMVKGIQIPYQVISYSGNASLFSNVTNVIDAFVPLNGIITEYSEFTQVSLIIDVGIVIQNASLPLVSFVFKNMFPTDYPYSFLAISSTGYAISRVLNLGFNITTLVFYEIQPNGLDISFTMAIPPNAPILEPFVSDPLNYNYIVYK